MLFIAKHQVVWVVPCVKREKCLPSACSPLQMVSFHLALRVSWSASDYRLSCLAKWREMGHSHSFRLTDDHCRTLQLTWERTSELCLIHRHIWKYPDLSSKRYRSQSIDHDKNRPKSMFLMGYELNCLDKLHEWHGGWGLWRSIVHHKTQL